MINRILIANRGEIAVRIIRACREMGIETVAVYSSADRESLHVMMADEAYCIGGPKLGDSYLKEETIITVAQMTGCSAIHPGYGMLSENPSFARKVTSEGLVFIGPSADLIEKMGNKEEARRIMKSLGVPVIPGAESIGTLDEAMDAAEKAGYPVLLKAAAGGGGKGIKLVTSPEEMEGAWKSARQESLQSFKNGTLYIEKYLTDVKHVEVQVLCDQYGEVLVLGERDCSVQRRNQKLIEESPCIMLSDEKRRQITEISRKAMEGLGYEGAGTLEFLMDEDENFYFMEMNTRLQVEHTVTEMVTGTDLVKWQIRIASGVHLTAEEKTSGHAIECRILAEDPERGYLAQSGKLSLLMVPGGPSVRFDTYLYSGAEVSPYYDSMIGKLIVWEKTREDAIRKMKSALGELVTEGIKTSADFEIKIMNSDKFRSGTFKTGDLEKL